jgi:hypothetical protein
MSEKTYQRIFLLFFAFLAISLVAPVNYATVGVDAGWTEAILMMIQKGKIFGKDLMFTYGPLGYLSFKIPPEKASVIPLLLMDILSIAHLIFLLKLTFDRFEGKKWTFPAIIGLIIIFPWGLFADLSFTFLYFFIFWILYAYYWNKSIGTWAALCIVILLFFVKVNISLIVCFLFLLSSIILVASNKINWKLAVLQNLLLVAGIVVGSKLLNVDLINYILYSLPLIDSYQDSMATIIISNKDLAIFLVLEAMIFAVFCWQIFVQKASFKHHFYLYFLLLILSFLGFKQAHTAISNPNLFGFFLLLPMVNGLLFLFSDKDFQTKIGWGFVGVLCLNLIATQYIRYSDGNHSLKGYMSTFRAVNVNPIRYFDRLFSYSYAENFNHKPLQLPSEIKNKIGQKTVDILHNDIAYVFFNELNYNPRPIIQTYSAYADVLMKLNGQKFASQTAPAFVLFKLEQFREQNPFWADTDVNFELLNRYSVDQQFTVGKDTLLLLNKTQAANHFQPFVLRFDHIKQNEFIPLPQKSEPYKMIAHLEYSLWGKLCRLLFQPPYMYCTVYYADGSQKDFRVVDKILKAGVLANKRVLTQQELLTFYTSKGQKNINVTGLKFHSRFPWAFL